VKVEVEVKVEVTKGVNERAESSRVESSLMPCARYIMALESRVAKLEHALAQIDPLHPEINDHYNPSDSPPRSEGTGGRQGTHRPVDRFEETPSFTFAKIVKR
jgi:hypothetical protein